MDLHKILHKKLGSDEEKMPSIYKGRKLKVRKVHGKKKEGSDDSYLEVTIPSILRDNVVKAGDRVVPYYDGVIIYVPEGKEIKDLEKLSATLKEIVIDEQK